jgi:hypothetical protein
MERVQRVGGLGEPAQDGKDRQQIQDDPQQIALPQTGEQIPQRCEGAHDGNEANHCRGKRAGDA